MLEEAAGQRSTSEFHHDLDHLAGTWTDEEAAAFDAVLVEQRQIDPEIHP
jgi:hypothetical protein